MFGAALQSLGNDLRQRDDGRETGRIRGTETVFPVRKLRNTVHHAHGHLFAADRAAVIVLHGLFRREAHPAVPVAVVMVFPLFGEELDGARRNPFLVLMALIIAG